MQTFKKKARNIAAGVSKALDFPLEAVSSEVTLELKGTREAHILSCHSILEFSSELVVIECASGKLRIVGKDLVISDFIGCAVSVCGVIRSLELEGEQSC